METIPQQTGEVIDVIVIVDPDYGARIEAAVQIAPVWAIESAANRAACERIRAAHQDSEDPDMVTCFSRTEEDRLRSLTAIISAAELHHGTILDEDSCVSFSNGSVVGVLGLAPTKAVASALAELGFAVSGELPGGFKARKRQRTGNSTEHPRGC